MNWLKADKLSINLFREMPKMDKLEKQNKKSWFKTFLRRIIFQDIFTQLDEFKAFELLRSGLDRTRYLCVKEAKIIAMTCTHAALKRKELVNMGFKYDNILMEESAQVRKSKYMTSQILSCQKISLTHLVNFPASNVT